MENYKRARELLSNIAPTASNSRLLAAVLFVQNDYQGAIHAARKGLALLRDERTTKSGDQGLRQDLIDTLAKSYMATNGFREVLELIDTEYKNVPNRIEDGELNAVYALCLMFTANHDKLSEVVNGVHGIRKETLNVVLGMRSLRAGDTNAAIAFCKEGLEPTPSILDDDRRVLYLMKTNLYHRGFLSCPEIGKLFPD